jgi:glutathione S-transferase
VRLYDAVGPHPSVVRMFLAEKGLQIPSEILVLAIGAGRTPAHLARNPIGEAPVLETDDGQYISESVAICEYLEEIHPFPVLIGCSPAERAETRMWARRVEFNICVPLLNGHRFGSTSLIRARQGLATPSGSRESRAMASAALAWLEGQMGQRDYLCGDRFSFADILLYSFVNFGISTGQLLDPDWTALARWRERIRSRPSAGEAGAVRVEAMALSGTV